MSFFKIITGERVATSTVTVISAIFICVPHPFPHFPTLQHVGFISIKNVHIFYLTLMQVKYTNRNGFFASPKKLKITLMQPNVKENKT